MTADEIMHAALVGVRRRACALIRDRRPRYGYDGLDPWTVDIEGAAAEMIVARTLGLYWNPAVGNLDTDGDIAPGVQVRSTTRENGCLILHPEDDDDHLFYLVVGRIPSPRVVGSLLARDGKEPRFWRDDLPRPAFFVPQQHLAPIVEINGAARAAQEESQ